MLFEVEYHKTWAAFFEDPDVKAAISDIEAQIAGQDFFPLVDDVLRFSSVDLSQVRYVLVGQDPYHSLDKEHRRPQATGRSFEAYELIGEGWDHPIRQRSLQNILKALYYAQTGKKASLPRIRELISTGEFHVAPPGELFVNLERQGILFLNATLTVPPGEPGKHHILWKEFRRRLVDYIVTRKPDAEWILWGDDVKKLIGPLPTNVKTHECCHPRRLEFIEQSNISSIDVSWAV
ncbi:MAG: hypothetical protein IJI68_11480 [Eggerthellaceae bacterium]|nr:hypothetical protein [Eggerthellaceae bacterium]